MASVKQARVIQLEKWQDDVCRIVCEIIGPEVLGFKGGQYIIVNSGKTLPNGKLGKRAYSILSSDTEQQRFELAIKKIPQGVGSGFMHELKVSDVFEFSGPWGKYQAAQGNQEQRVLCIATDTGITAALGLLRAQALKSFLGGSKLIWVISSLDYFIPVPFVQSWLPQSLSFQWVFSVPVVGDESRMVSIEEKTAQIMGDQIFTKIYLSGDGRVLRKLKDGFLMSGDYREDQIVVEPFFHHESLKSVTVYPVEGKKAPLYGVYKE